MPPPYAFVIQGMLVVDSNVQTIYVERVRQPSEGLSRQFVPVLGQIDMVLLDSTGAVIASFTRSAESPALFTSVFTPAPSTRYRVLVTAGTDTALALVRTPARPTGRIPLAAGDTLPRLDSVTVYVGPADASAHVAVLRRLSGNQRVDSISLIASLTHSSWPGKVVAIGDDTLTWIVTRFPTAGQGAVDRVQLVLANVDVALTRSIILPGSPTDPATALTGSYGFVGAAAFRSSVFVLRPE